MAESIAWRSAAVAALWVVALVVAAMWLAAADAALWMVMIAW